MKIEQFFLEGLGHQSYIVSDEQSGSSAIVDPRRDVDIYLEAAKRTGMRITHILETHIHNDYVTGSRELAAKSGAAIMAGALEPLDYLDLAVKDNDRFRVGDLHFSTLATPGHTPAHVSYLLAETASDEPTALFSGGSMLVGNAGRTDLLGDALTLTLTRQQYHSLRRMLETLPGRVRVYPTHGAGSFCAASAADNTRSTTIAQERLVSPAVLAKDEDDFVRRQIAGYIAYPKYYDYIHDVNKYGPTILGSLPVPPALAPRRVQEYMQRGMPLLDGRNRKAFARAHIPGALNIELDGSFGTYAGWVLPFNIPVMLLIEDEAGCREAVVQLIRIGYERIEGYLDGGMSAWEAAALPVDQFENIDVDELYQRWLRRSSLLVVDVRRDDEWDEGHIPDALHLHLGDLPQHIDEVPRDQPIAVICRSGYRASIGASILAAAGRDVTAVSGGVPDWIERGFPSVP